MAQTLKFGNGTWATKKGSILAHNDEGGNFKPLPFTYTGAGKGTRVNKEGLIEVVENDRPRIDYTDSEDGVFLLENASTNLILQSSSFEGSTWNNQNVSVSDNVITSPDGTLNGGRILETAITGNHGIYQTNSIVLDPNIKYSFSCFVKKLGRRYVALQGWHGSNRGNIAQFDLDRGELSYSNALSTGYTITDSKITALENGWFKISTVITTNYSESYIGIVSCDKRWTQGTSYENHYLGDVTKGFYLYGFQYEQNSVASSYIPTQGTIQTRVQETAIGSGNSEVFNDTQGVLFANIAANADDGINKYISLSDGSVSNRVNIFFDSSNNLRGFYNGISGSIIINTDITLNNKIAFKYKSGDISFWFNGFEVATRTDALSLSGLNSVSFDLGGGSNFYGKTKEIGYYDEILTDLELETLTSYRSWEAMVKELNLNIIHNE
jgi:hypothetical protein